MDKISQHETEAHENLKRWENKPVLQDIYHAFYSLIQEQLDQTRDGIIVELGSGIGNLKQIVPECLCTDSFPSPWIDQTENAYKLSFADASVSNIILFDVFHHLRYPGTALKECARALKPGGKLVIFEPCMSLLGLVVYGLLHHEPIKSGNQIEWFAPDAWSPDNDDYYAAQGNASRIFLGGNYLHLLDRFKLTYTKRLSAISYVASGGYSGPQLYPTRLFPLMQCLDRICDIAPWIFATRLLVVLTKKQPEKAYYSASNINNR